MPPSASPLRTKSGIVHPSVVRSMAKLGADIALARRSRKISSEELAERMGVSRGTLRRLEHGDPGIALNTLAMALSALGMLDRLTDMVDQSTDDIGLMTARETLGKRVGRARLPKSVASSDGGTDQGSSEPEAW